MSPRCSIVVPVFNKAGLTRKCLEALFERPPGVDFEVIVVDDASTDSTPPLLEEYGENLKVVTHSENLGFAASCNDGAAVSNVEFVVFLNNDTIPLDGWLDALVAYADQHPEAAVVGSKLLFPNDTIQHAGVVICPERNPRHIYVGFPTDHPAVNKSRRFQAVTFACALVRKEVFDDAGHLDTAFHNDLEDVDFCLRLGELGHEIHYCHESVLYHLESVSRGRQLPKDSSRLYRRRWSERVEPDDYKYFLQDELLQVRYKEPFPIRMKVSPRLAVTNGWGSTSEAERLLHSLSGQVLDLLQETVRLTAHIADLELGASPGAAAPEDGAEREPATEVLSYDGLHRITRSIELEIQSLQRSLATAIREQRFPVSEEGSEEDWFTPSDYLDYRRLLVRIKEVASNRVPVGSLVLVVSRGDGELLELEGRRAWHFPRQEDGSHPGYNPPDSAWAIAHLEELRGKGAQYLLIPSTEQWWLEHYEEFGKHLDGNYTLVAEDDETCLIFALDAGTA
jgi:GT2 family glycosyltransferase